MIFFPYAIDKMDDRKGRAAIIENGSPLFKGYMGCRESQIRRWKIENDLIEAMIALPTDLFCNTGFATFIWVLSKNKRTGRKGKKGNIIYDNNAGDIEIVNHNESLDDYLAREAPPYVPDAKAFFEEKADAKKPIMKIWAEIPFARIFYKCKEQESSDKMLQEFIKLDEDIQKKVARLVK